MYTGSIRSQQLLKFNLTLFMNSLNSVCDEDIIMDNFETQCDQNSSWSLFIYFRLGSTVVNIHKA